MSDLAYSVAWLNHQKTDQPDGDFLGLSRANHAIDSEAGKERTSGAAQELLFGSNFDGESVLA